MMFRDRLYRFLYGRYGMDELYKVLLLIFIVGFIANIFVGSLIFSIVLWLIWGFALFRMFSRNIAARRRENGVYLRFKGKITRFFSLRLRKWRERKTHVFKKCPHCKATVRLPRVKGKHGVNCPKCRRHFEVKI